MNHYHKDPLNIPMVMMFFILMVLCMFFTGCGTTDQLTEQVSIQSNLERPDGLPFYSNENPRRIPSNYVPRVSEGVKAMSLHPSGGRYTYRTDAVTLTIQSSKGYYSIYLDGEAYKTNLHGTRLIDIPYAKPYGIEYRTVTIYMAHNSTGSIESINFDNYSHLERIYEDQDTQIVFYGSSITQAGLATEPGLTFPAQISRALELDFVNMGMSGSGLGELELAEILGQIPAQIYVLDFWANPSPSIYEQNLEPFLIRLRELRPNTPILITTPFYTPGREQEHQAKLETIERVMAKGLSKVYLHNQMSLAPAMPDNRHPSDSGLTLIADSMTETIKQILTENK